MNKPAQQQRRKLGQQQTKMNPKPNPSPKRPQNQQRQPNRRLQNAQGKQQPQQQQQQPQQRRQPQQQPQQRRQPQQQPQQRRQPQQQQQPQQRRQPQQQPQQRRQPQQQQGGRVQQRDQSQVRGRQTLSLTQQKAQKVQQRVDSRRRLQQNRMKVNRPGSVTSNPSGVSDAKLLKIAKALLLKRTGSSLIDFPTTNLGYSARLMTRRGQPQTSSTSAPNNRKRWNRTTNANTSEDSLITVNVKNELANGANSARRRRLNWSQPSNVGPDFLIQTVNNTPHVRQAPARRAPMRQEPMRQEPMRQEPVHRAPAVSDIVKSMRPKVEMSYDFSKDVFAQAKTGLGLSDRFSHSSSSSRPTAGPQQQQRQLPAPPGSRQVYL